MAEKRTCQNCKSEFVIEPGDLDFYKKIDVPAPTFCFECRLKRHLIWRNERGLYKRKCDVPGHAESIICMYHPDAPVTVYDHAYWWSDAWDPMSYGKEYNFSRPFFEQWKELLYAVPTPALINIDGVESDYCNFTYQSKNCYLNFASDMNEDTAYLYHSIHNKNSCDMLGSAKNENSYELVDSSECYDCEHMTLSESCMESKYCYDCRNCKNCIGCCGLRNKKYCILNEQFSEEGYEKKIAELNLGTRSGRAALEEKFNALALSHPKKFSNSRHTAASTGDYLKEVKNCRDCFDIEGPMEDSRFVIYGVTNMKSVYDAYAIGVNIENSYDVMDAGSNMQNTAFSGNVWDSYHIRYGYFLRNCSNCFGCVSLRSKQYCILNKQYTKEEYEALLPKVKQHMMDMPYTDKKGRVYRYGEFFPVEFSPFAYNEAAIQDYFPLRKEEISDEEKWREFGGRGHTATIEKGSVPEDIDAVPSAVVKEVIACAHAGKCSDRCTEAFKIVPLELVIYKKLGIPLPELCPNCRHAARFAKRNPPKLWHRSCQCAGTKSEKGVYANTAKHFHGDTACPNEFETSYAPEKPEFVYCEECYQAEVV